MLRRFGRLHRASQLVNALRPARAGAVRMVHTPDDVAEHHHMEHEDEVYPPPASFTARSHIKSLDQYKEMY